MAQITKGVHPEKSREAFKRIHEQLEDQSVDDLQEVLQGAVTAAGNCEIKDAVVQFAGWSAGVHATDALQRTKGDRSNAIDAYFGAGLEDFTEALRACGYNQHSKPLPHSQGFIDAAKKK